MTDVVNVGSTDNDGNGDTLRAAFSQINTRFNELLSTIDGGDAWATGVTYTATPIRQWVIESGQAYVAAVNHVSGASFAADLSAGKWFAVDSAQILADLAAPTGASLIGYTPTGLLTATTVEGALNEVRDASKVSYTPAGTGAVATTVQSKLRESVSVKDFGADNTGAVDATAAFMLALNSGAKTIHVPSGTYLQSAPLQIQAAALGIRLVGEDKQNTILRWVINTGTVSKFATLLDGYVGFENMTLENAGNDQTNSCGLVSYTPTVANGMHDSFTRKIRLKGWGAGIGASINGTSLTMARSQVFACIFEDTEFYGCGKPIQLGVGVNNNVWIRPSFLDNKGNRHIFLVEGSSNLFISPQFEPVNVSVTSGMLNAELVLSPNNMFLNAYFEPCYGILADSSPGTVIEAPIIEGFDFTIGTLSSSAILRSTNASNGGVYASPIVSKVSLPVSRAATNPTSYCVSDDTTNTMTLIDARTSRDSNFQLRAPGQYSHAQIPVAYRGVWQPTIVGTSGTSVHTYTQQLGWYIRTGQQVTVFFRVAISAKDAGMGGNATIAGLPFPVSTDTSFSSAPIFAEYRVDLSVGYSSLQGETSSGGSSISLVEVGDNIAPVFLPSSGILSVTVFVGQMTYITDAA